MAGESHQHRVKAKERGRRGHSRLRVRLPARLVTRTETLRVVLSDLSAHGASILIRDPLPIGMEAVVEWGGFDAFGEVAWSDAQRCGLRFLDPIDPAILVATRQLDDCARLPCDGDLVRQVAHGWAQGTMRL